MSVVDGSFGNPMRLEEEATAPLAGGIMNHGFQCGMLWGASLAAGAEAQRRFGPGPQAEATAMTITERLLESFQGRTQNEMNCTEITEINFQQIKGFTPILKYFVKGGKIGPGACFRLAAGYAQDARNTIEAALPDEAVEAPARPVSCASVMARKMGASEKHATMTAGFAGGIGLSGGGCGALGTARWLTAMGGREEGVSKIGYFDNVEYQAVIDRFVEATDCEFECSEIVGRHFESIEDHAAYLGDGGCSEIFEVLASQPVNEANEDQ
jgi:hypothetical protein